MSGTAPRRPRGIALILGALAAIGPFSTDMYLPAFPAIGAALGADAASVQRTLATYFFGLALGQAFYGPLADRFGRRAPLLGAMSLYTVVSIGCALATDIGALTWLRFLQALGACAGMVIARAVVRDLTDERGSVRLMAQLMAVMGIAPIVAPTVGAAVVDILGWRALFWMLGGYGALLVLIVLFLMPESLNPAFRRKDRLVAVLGVYLALLRDRHFMANALAGALPIAGMFAYISGASFVFMELHALSAGQFGIVFGVNAAGIILVSQLAARLALRQAPERVLPVTASVNAAAGLVLLASAISGVGGVWGLAVPLFVFIASLGSVLPLATALTMAPHGRVAGSASALLGTLQFGIGALCGAGLGVLHDGTARPMALMMALCACGGWAARRVLLRGR